ncbi:MAG TPA: signal peptide peptidase SppA [Chthoniobacteraceae bacterium]|jgi:protease-4
MTNARFGCLGVGLVIILALSILLNFFFLVANSASVATSSLMPAALPKFDEALVSEGKNSDQRIAVVYLRGIISSSEPGTATETAVEDLKLQLKQAVDDEKVKAIVLYIDSPGGEVTASDSIYNAVRRTRDKKPVVVYMGSLAASGGYYVACGGSWLIANETTFTGSIGVIMQTLNYQALFDKVGLSMWTFKSGKFKDMLSGSRPITEEEQAYVQGLVMQTYSKFVGIVAKERNLPEEQLRNGVADGRVISGKDALEAKLINQVGEVEDAYAKARELAGAPDASVIRYESRLRLRQLFRMLGKSDNAKIEVDLAAGLVPKLEAGRLYFLPNHFAP